MLYNIVNDPHHKHHEDHKGDDEGMKNMTRKYTVSELSQELGVSVNTVWKKIKKRGLSTTKDTVNNRVITFVLLADDEYQDLISERDQINQVMKGDYNPNYEDFETIHEGVKVAQPQHDYVALVERIMDYSKEMNNQVKDYIERVIEAEKQVKLLEDSENRKEQEYYRLIAENKELKTRVEELEKKVLEYESRWWNKGLFKGK